VLWRISAGLGVSIMPSAMPEQLFYQFCRHCPIRRPEIQTNVYRGLAHKSTNPSVELFLNVIREVTGNT
jgi:hypothetical protein